jgi:3-oxoacyl-[acyl-carrier-protein] synthase-3
MIGSATSNGRVSITGIGSRAPERVMTNDELAQMVDTSDEWIMERTGIRERRVAAPEEALSDLPCRPRSTRSSTRASSRLPST